VTLSDVWIINLEKNPYSWNKIQSEGVSPCARVYHSAAYCSIGSAS